MPQVIDRTPVQSSNIASIGHDPATDTLHVEFRSGATWAYDGVDADRHAELLNADSVGSHFAKHIRGKFPGRRIN